MSVLPKKIRRRLLTVRGASSVVNAVVNAAALNESQLCSAGLFTSALLAVGINRSVCPTAPPNKNSKLQSVEVTSALDSHIETAPTKCRPPILQSERRWRVSLLSCWIQNQIPRSFARNSDSDLPGVAKKVSGAVKTDLARTRSGPEMIGLRKC